MRRSLEGRRLFQCGNPEKEGGRELCIFLQETYSYKFWKDLQVNSTAFKCFCVEDENKNSKNIVLNLVYRPPNGDHRELENYFKSSVSKQEISHKDIILARDFNINLLDFDANKKDQNFVNLMFRFGMILANQFVIFKTLSYCFEGTKR